MQQFICPRCKFRLVNGKRTCATCGFNMPRTGDTKDSASDTSNKDGSFWSKFLGVDSAGSKKPESAQEKPALG
jgi:hypothetical protein